MAKAIALFPGSFKPPHADHLHGIRYLLDRGDVASVVIIISNRARLVPGTHLAIDAESAHTLMRTLLHAAGFPMERIVIEVAEHRATSHANAYLDQRDDGGTYYLCVGSADRDLAQQRFPNLEARTRRSNKQASIIVLPSPPRGVHATEIRTALGRGVAGRKAFIASLPECLTEPCRLAIWAECANALQPMEKIARRKVRDLVATVSGIENPQLDVLDAESASPCFVLHQDQLPDLIVKYAGDTTGSSSFASRQVPKPARRLAVERRVMKHVVAHLEQPFLLPRVRYFDKLRRILILESIAGSQEARRFRHADANNLRRYAALAGSFLGKLHCLPLPLEPFWGDAGQEREHWHALIVNLEQNASERLASLGSQDFPLDLVEMAQPYSGSRVLHLNFTLDKLTALGQNVLVEDFERAGSFGDKAYDVATIVASSIVNGWRKCGAQASCVAMGDMMTAYHRAGSAADKSFWQRLMTYVACCLLSPFHLGDSASYCLSEAQRDELAIALLDRVSVGAGADGEQVFFDVLICYARRRTVVA